MLAAGGAFGGDIIIGDLSAGNVLATSPFQINYIATTISWFGILITAAIMGKPVLRDFEYRMHCLYYSTPISKKGYLFGRFFGSFVVTCLVFTGMFFGAVLATYMPWMDPAKVGAFELMGYLQPYFLIILPNLFLTGALFFTLATLTRSSLSIYVGAVIFLVLYGISNKFITSLEQETLAVLLDPLGSSAIYFTQRYWTIAERNDLMLPFSSQILLNRAFWTAFGVCLLTFCYYRFSFSFAVKSKKVKNRKQAKSSSFLLPIVSSLKIPKVKKDFSLSQNWRQFQKLTMTEVKSIYRSVYFKAMVMAGVIFMIVAATQIQRRYGTSFYPVTPEIIMLLSGTFSLFFFLIITFYAGELVWRERNNRINQLFDALPIPSWLPFTSKLSALVLLQVILLAIIMICGIAVQTFKGYYNYEFDIYFKGLFLIELIDYTLLCVLALFVHVLVNNKYFGHFIMLLYYLLSIFKNQLGLEHNLLFYNSDPGISYSAMNLYGHFVWPFAIFKIYWAAFAVMLGVLGSLWWVRGAELKLKWRLKLAQLRINKSHLLTLSAALIIFLFTGAYIFYNTNILNSFHTGNQNMERLAMLEKKYKKFENYPQPRITDVNLNVAIFPEERDFVISGTYWLKNKNNQPIDSIHVIINPQIKVRELKFNQNFKEIVSDERVGYHIYQLSETLEPGDSIQLQMNLTYFTEGFQNNGSNTDIVFNGTFIGNKYLPKIGYSSRMELSSDEARKKVGLEPKGRMKEWNNKDALKENYISSDADWIDFEAIVSTSADQIAIAPGNLQREWLEDGRRYFHYKMDAPILNFYSFLSADYEIKKDIWTDPDGKEVAIQIFYQDGHEYNLNRMIKAVKESLNYYTTHFGPYQHGQVRIVEFPNYRTGAQSFPNTIPFSENIGFIADVRKAPPAVDYPFLITAHEVAHQWWGHQLVPANVPGSALLTETLSQYSALMVIKKEYGKENIQKLMDYEMDMYLRGRTAENKKEMPLYKVENQEYIHYNKGSITMYALADYIGEEKLNKALQNFLQEVTPQEPPYTTTVEFMEHIREATPDSLQYLVTDMFEKISLYENKIITANYEELQNRNYKVSLVVEAKKVYSDGLGNEKEVSVNDWIDIGVLDGNNQPLYLQKHKLKTGRNEFTIVVEQEPIKAGIDPYNILIDRNPEDNVKPVKK